MTKKAMKSMYSSGMKFDEVSIKLQQIIVEKRKVTAKKVAKIMLEIFPCLLKLPLKIHAEAMIEKIIGSKG